MVVRMAIHKGLLRVLIVDDEPLARLRLTALVNEAVDGHGLLLAQVVAAADGRSQAEAWLGRERIDVVLLDIQMPGVDGLSMAAHWQSAGRLMSVVFVTAHPEHALRAFDLDAVDYLTKPVRRERLQAALERAAWRRGLVGAETLPRDDESATLLIQERGRTVRLPLGEVVFVRAELKYLTVATAQGHFLLDDSLTDLENRYPDHFVRVHRNALVARAAMRVLARRPVDSAAGGGESWSVQLAPTGDWMPVSRRQLAVVREAMGPSAVAGLA
jgi:two-component system response regulator AlgR